jgi:glucosamine--fructose-6-phosphate aminotransferase (isomerizing)
MDIADSITKQEILAQPEALAGALSAVDRQARALMDLWGKRSYKQVLFTGCGSTYYLSLGAAMVFEELTGVISRAIPAGEFLVSPSAIPAASSGPTLLVVVSRSGTTSETVRAAAAFREAGAGDTIAITCRPGDAPADLGNVSVNIPEAQEVSIAQTRAFSAMWLSTCAIAALLSGNRALQAELRKTPDLSARVINAVSDRATALGGDLTYDRVYYLGSHFRYSLASEGCLKMKEMTLTHTEPFHFLEFRHGPISMVTESTIIAALTSDDPGGHEAAVLKDIQDLGARLFVLGEAVPELGAQGYSFRSGLGEIARSVLYLPPLQLLALGRSAAKGLNPDKPKNLSAVVYLRDGTTPAG